MNEWEIFTKWCDEKCPDYDSGNESPPFGRTDPKSYVPLYDLMGMIGTTGLIFLLHYYHPKTPYSFRYNLGYKRSIFRGGVEGRLAQVNRRTPSYYTVPEALRDDSVVFTVAEWEFQITLVYNKLFFDSHWQGMMKYKISDCEKETFYSLADIENIRLGA